MTTSQFFGCKMALSLFMILKVWLAALPIPSLHIPAHSASPLLTILEGTTPPSRPATPHPIQTSTPSWRSLTHSPSPRLSASRPGFDFSVPPPPHAQAVISLFLKRNLVRQHLSWSHADHETQQIRRREDDLEIYTRIQKAEEEKAKKRLREIELESGEKEVRIDHHSCGETQGTLSLMSEGGRDRAKVGVAPFISLLLIALFPTDPN